jgi:MFS family permease
MSHGFVRGHPRLIILVGACLGLDALFFSALAPLLPRYVEQHDLSSAETGFLVATDAIGNLMTVPFAAWAVQRWGPRTILVASLLGVGAGSVVFGLAQSVWLLDLSRGVVGGLGTFAWAAAFTWLVRRVDRDQRARSIGVAIGSSAAGALLGPGLGSLAAYTSPAAVFGAVGAGNVLLAAMALRTPGPDGDAVGAPGLWAIRGRLGPGSAKPLIGLAWLMTLPAVAGSVLLVQIPLRLDEYGLTAAAIGLVFITVAIGDMVISPLVGWWADRRGRMGPLRVGALSLGFGALLMALLQRPIAIVLLTLLVGGALIMLGGPTLALLADHFDAIGLPYELGFSSQTLCWAVGHSVGAVGSGVIAGTAPCAPFAAISALALATYWGLSRPGIVPHGG